MVQGRGKKKTNGETFVKIITVLEISGTFIIIILYTKYVCLVQQKTDADKVRRFQKGNKGYERDTPAGSGKN